MFKLTKVLAAKSGADFKKMFKEEIQQLDTSLLPLQDGLSQTSYVGDTGINVVILNISETENNIQVKASIFYSGIIAGSCCADDPTPVDTQTEHCDMQFYIDKQTAETKVVIINNWVMRVIFKP